MPSGGFPLKDAVRFSGTLRDYQGISMRKLTLHFAGDEKIELFEACFIHPVIGEERRCIRGKRSGAYRGYSTFQWTKAVQALSLLMVEAALRNHTAASGPLLRGTSGSFASSLDYAIDKQTTWLYDMFGWDDRGTGFSRRLFIRSNPGQRLTAPVAISLNLNCLACSEISIFQNYEPVTDRESLELLLKKLEVVPESVSNDDGVGNSQSAAAAASLCA
jgi:hypothetical protein